MRVAMHCYSIRFNSYFLCVIRSVLLCKALKLAASVGASFLILALNFHLARLFDGLTDWAIGIPRRQEEASKLWFYEVLKALSVIAI